MTNLRQRNRRGTHAIEFALVFPVLLLATSGLVDYGWFFVQQHTTSSAVRDAARAAATYPIEMEPGAVAKVRLATYLDDAGLPADRTVDASVVGEPGDQRVSVKVAIPFTALFGLLPVPAELNGTVEMYLEQQPRPSIGGDLDGVSDVLK